MVDFLWHLIGGELVREGRPPPREGLVYGQYLPQAAGAGIGGTGSNYGTSGVTAGLINSSLLSNHNASSTPTLTLTDGQILTDKTVYGYLRLPSTHNSDIVLTNCLVRGGPTAPGTTEAIVKADNTRSGTGRLILRDCEVWPQAPGLIVDGVRGNRIVLERCWIHDVIDGFVPYATPSQNSGNAFSYMWGTVVERMRYMFPDTEHTDGTHNDLVAISGGKEIGIKGNLLYGSSVDLPGSGANPTHPQIQASGYMNGACIIVTDTVGNPLNNTVIVEENWFWGGLTHANIKSNMTMIWRNNRHYRAVFIDTVPPISSSGYWCRYDFPVSTGVTINNDTWVDGPYAGNVLTLPQDLGIHHNTS